MSGPGGDGTPGESFAVHQMRCVLIVDDDASGLGGVSLGLNRMGVDAYYSNDRDEALLMARELGDRIGLVALPMGLVEQELPRLLKQVVEPRGLPASAVVPIGALPDDATRARMRDAGLAWTCNTDLSDHELGTALRLALGAHDDLDLRADPRVPADLAAQFHKGPLRKPGRLIDLSSGGAFFEIERPLPVGSQISVAFALESQELMVRTEVRWVSQGSADEGKPAGMGLHFIDGPGKGRDAVARYIAAQIQRFRL